MQCARLYIQQVPAQSIFLVKTPFMWGTIIIPSPSDDGTWQGAPSSQGSIVWFPTEVYFETVYKCTPLVHPAYESPLWPGFESPFKEHRDLRTWGKGVRAGENMPIGKEQQPQALGQVAFPAICSQTASKPPDDGGLSLFHPFITCVFLNVMPSPKDSSPFLTTSPNKQPSMKWGENDGLILSN